MILILKSLNMYSEEFPTMSSLTLSIYDTIKKYLIAYELILNSLHVYIKELINFVYL